MRACGADDDGDDSPPSRETIDDESSDADDDEALPRTLSRAPSTSDDAASWSSALRADDDDPSWPPSRARPHHPSTLREPPDADADAWGLRPERRDADETSSLPRALCADDADE